MTQQALGMIETYGLVAAIEAADIALKTAAVRLVGYEKVKSGRTMIAFIGEVAAVQASVTAGSAAAGKINTVFSRHVIPRPIADIGLLVSRGDGGPEPAGSGPAGPEPAGPKPAGPGPEGPDGNGPVSSGPKDAGPQGAGPAPAPAPEAGKKAKQSGGALDGLSVEELRRIARKTDGIAFKGRQISRANKGQLIAEILRAKKSK